jgi:hypothetical protein
MSQTNTPNRKPLTIHAGRVSNLLRVLAGTDGRNLAGQMLTSSKRDEDRMTQGKLCSQILVCLCCSAEALQSLA